MASLLPFGAASSDSWHHCRKQWGMCNVCHISFALRCFWRGYRMALVDISIGSFGWIVASVEKWHRRNCRPRPSCASQPLQPTAGAMPTYHRWAASRKCFPNNTPVLSTPQICPIKWGNCGSMGRGDSPWLGEPT